MARRAESFLVWGAGGHGAVIADLVRAAGHRLAGFADRDLQRAFAAARREHAKLALPESRLLELLAEGKLPDKVSCIALGIGQNGTRRALGSTLDGVKADPLVHPSAAVAPSVAIGAGTVILAAAVVNAHAQLGAGVIINSGAIVEHDCVVEDAAHVAPGAVLTGGVRVGRMALIGARAVIAPGVRVGPGAVVGAGAVVLADVPNITTVAGNPARPTTSHR